jgi:hypothetical protein
MVFMYHGNIIRLSLESNTIAANPRRTAAFASHRKKSGMSLPAHPASTNSATL